MNALCEDDCCMLSVLTTDDEGGLPSMVGSDGMSGVFFHSTTIERQAAEAVTCRDGSSYLYLW